MLSPAVFILAAASAASSPALTAHAPWWERTTVTINADGSRQSCRYETSLADRSREGCEQAPAEFKRTAESTGAATRTKITLERRFTPARQPDFGSLEPGDTLLAGHVMMLAIDGEGAVRACEVVAEAGDSKPAYGCDEVRAERFKARGGRGASEAGLAYLTVLIYGHEEQVA